MNSNVIHLTECNFDSIALDSGDKPVLVDFWAPWCGPCRAIAPIIDQLADAYAGRAVIAKVNVDEEPRLSQAARIQAIPTMVLLHRGKVVEVIQGLRPKGDLQARIDALLDSQAKARGEADASAVH